MSFHSDEIYSLFIVYCVRCNDINDNIPFNECNNCYLSTLINTDTSIKRKCSCCGEYSSINSNNKQCNNCLDKQKKYILKRKIKYSNELENNKVCRHCFKENDNLDFKICSKCREKSKQHSRIRRQKIINNNKCINCFRDNDLSKIYRICTICREKRKQK